MPPYDGRLSGGAACPLCRGVASSETEMSYLLEGGLLPSSEAETRGAVEGPGGESSSKAEIVPWGREGCEWAACWASLSHLVSSRLEGGRGLSWTQLP